MAPGAIRHRHLEHVLRQIDRYGRRLHVPSSWLPAAAGSRFGE